MRSMTDLEKIQSMVSSKTLHAEMQIQREHGALEIDSPFRLEAHRTDDYQQNEERSD